MKLNTKYHGIKEYKNEDLIEFPKGLPGFEKLKNFIMFPVEENDLFSVLHSTEDEDIGLVVMSPFNVRVNYELKLSDEVLKNLRINEDKDVLVVNTVTLSSKVEDITVNLKAPIIINIKERLGEQIILDKEEYLIKQPLFGE
jgi:flagellar assembly factor FliW